MGIVHDILSAIEKHAEKQAFCIEDTYYSYLDFSKAIAKVQKAVQTQIGPNEKHVGLVANNDLETYAAIMALWLEGKAYIPLNPQAPKSRNLQVVEQSGIKSIIDSSKSSLYTGYTIIPSKQLAETSNPVKISQYHANNLAYIFFTSGTTGTPKGVQITHGNLNAFAEAFWKLNYNIDHTDRCLQMFDLTFDLSVVSFIAPLMRGACIYTVSSNNIKYLEVLKIVSRYQLTFTLMVPSILHALRPFFKKIHCPSLKYSMFCGEALHLDIAEAWSQCVPNATIANVYGPTECTIYCTDYTYKRQGGNKAHNGILSVGKAMANTKTIIVDTNNTPLGPNEEGELCLSGKQLTKGYWNNEAINQKVFFNLTENGITTRYYKTGDLCKKDEEGDILYLGRLDFQAKVQGYRVELSEIEFYAKKILKDTNLVALIVKNKLNNAEVAMAIEGQTIDIQSFTEKLKGYLPDYMIPNKIEFYKAFPLNANGKTDRKAIIKHIEEHYG